MDAKKYNVNFDLINILSCIAVVAMHINSSYWTFEHNTRWVFSCFVGSFCSFAVPVFIMLSGANLIGYNTRYSTKDFFKKRLLKTVVPFLIWSVISIIFWCLRFGTEEIIGNSAVTGIINAIFNTKTTEYYWFFIPLFIVYLSIPFFSAISEDKRQKVFGYAIVCGILLNALLPYISELCGIQYNSNFNFPITSSYLIYALIGYYISHYTLKLHYRICIYISGIASLMLNFAGTVVSSFKYDALTNVLDGNLQFARIFWSLAVFTLINNVKLDFLTKPKISSVIRTVSSLSFGVYLTHYFIIQIIYSFFAVNIYTCRWIVLGTLAVYLICLTVTFVIKKIPILKNIIP